MFVPAWLETMPATSKDLQPMADIPAALAALGQGSVPSLISNAPADNAAGMPDGGSGYAAASNECPTRAASEAGFSDHSVRLMKRRERHSLRGRCEGQRKGNRNHSNHRLSPSDVAPLLPVKQERPEAGMNRKVPLALGYRLMGSPRSDRYLAADRNGHAGDPRRRPSASSLLNDPQAARAWPRATSRGPLVRRGT
jgi:hypothetical protein